MAKNTYIPPHTLVILLILVFIISACAAKPDPDDPLAVDEYNNHNDPFEPVNRAIFKFNTTADRYIAQPVMNVYLNYVPQFAQDRVHDLVQTYNMPWTLVNDVIQVHPQKAAQTLVRLTFNLTFGGLGLFDVAGSLGLTNHENDFGQTLGTWGIPKGPYIMIPILGPTNLRDGSGRLVAVAGAPLGYVFTDIGAFWANYVTFFSDGFETRAELDGVMHDAQENSIDYYATVRSLYTQHRDFVVKQQSETTP